MPIPTDPPQPQPPPTCAPPPEPDLDPVLTVDELARLLRVNRKTVYEAFQRGEIPGGRRIGRAIRFARAVVLAWLAQGDPPPRPRPRPRPDPLAPTPRGTPRPARQP